MKMFATGIGLLSLSFKLNHQIHLLTLAMIEHSISFLEKSNFRFVQGGKISSPS